MSFTERLRQVQINQNSLLCIGLDADQSKIPAPLRTREHSVLEFNRRIIEATQDLVCAYKPNLAFYESLGEQGVTILRETLNFIPKSVLTIGDGKRGDIGNTAERYATSLFIDFGFDSATVNPYMGADSVEPFLTDPEKGVFILALTSNPGSKDFQRLKIGMVPLFEKVVRTVKKWNTNQNVGLVVGATHPRELQRIRRMVPDMPILIPGIGKQGGDLKSAVRSGCDRHGQLAIINASRSIIYASAGGDFAEAARAEAIKMRDEINLYRDV
ncbi:MAG: orotidine-5'-phosphate decarboxylase [Ignavibacteriae bacterium]|nr:MAG: orotidine-5'-phosphate decarboxylase [Ignavibacteriota bacterium]